MTDSTGAFAGEGAARPVELRVMEDAGGSVCVNGERPLSPLCKTLSRCNTCPHITLRPVPVRHRIRACPFRPELLCPLIRCPPCPRRPTLPLTY
eukprot:3829120-Pyramimonas_sp.AAC.2